MNSTIVSVGRPLMTSMAIAPKTAIPVRSTFKPGMRPTARPRYVRAEIARTAGRSAIEGGTAAVMTGDGRIYFESDLRMDCRSLRRDASGFG